jgi:hypothetical protein
VGDDDAYTPGDWGATGRAVAMTYVYRHGNRIAVDTIGTTPANRRKPFEVSFVKLPNFWIDQLRHARKVSTVTLAHVSYVKRSSVSV